MTRPKKKNPRELLDNVLRLMAKDIGYIEELVFAGKLEGEVASTLIKYGDALLKMSKEMGKEEDEEMDELSKLTDAQLKTKAQEIMERLKK